MNRALVIIFCLWGGVKLLDITYTHLIRPQIVGQRAAAKRPKPMPAPYADADRTRDAARAAWLQREAEKNPSLARMLRAQREGRTGR